MACNLKNVVSNAASCKENPAGLSNYAMVVPLDSDHISAIGPHDGKPEYVITPPQGSESLKGFRIEFKNQTGRVSSEDNGDGKAWTMTGTGRVEKNERDMAYVSRVLSNMDGKYLVFFPTGKIEDGKVEWKVVGNELGENTFQSAGDSGEARNDDHGLTFTVTCGYQVYPTMFWYGNITKEDDPSSSDLADDTSDMITIED